MMGHIMLYDPISPKKMLKHKAIKEYTKVRWEASTVMLETLAGKVLDSRKRIRPDRLLTGLQFRTLFHDLVMQVTNVHGNSNRTGRPITRTRQRQGMVAPFQRSVI